MRRTAPYASDHSRSQQRKMARPRDLLGWFMSGIREELPDRIHSAGVWRDRVNAGEAGHGIAPVGGSLLGSPRVADPFRSFIEGSPFTTEPSEYEGHRSIGNHYRTPMRAALARLAGRGRDSDSAPFMARTLYRTAIRDGDWDSACASMGIIEPVRRPYIDAALNRLYTLYREAPDAIERVA